MRWDGPNQSLRMFQPWLRTAPLVSLLWSFLFLLGVLLWDVSPLFTVFITFCWCASGSIPKRICRKFPFHFNACRATIYHNFTPPWIFTSCPGTTTSLLNILTAHQNTLLNGTPCFSLVCVSEVHTWNRRTYCLKLLQHGVFAGNRMMVFRLALVYCTVWKRRNLGWRTGEGAGR